MINKLYRCFICCPFKKIAEESPSVRGKKVQLKSRQNSFLKASEAKETLNREVCKAAVTVIRSINASSSSECIALSIGNSSSSNSSERLIESVEDFGEELKKLQEDPEQLEAFRYEDNKVLIKLKDGRTLDMTSYLIKEPDSLNVSKVD